MLKEMQDRLDDIERQMKTLGKARYELRDQIAGASTELKVGDWVTLDDGARVWELKKINAGYDGKPVFFGAKIKKDGKPGVVSREIWEAGYKKLRIWEAEIK
jgi:hypothetical protein